MKQQDAMLKRLFSSLLEQLESETSGIVYLAPEQLGKHDPLAVQALQARNLLQSSPPLSKVICDGCDWHCGKPVQFRCDAQGVASAAFIVCDEREGMGRVSVALSRLNMRAFTLAGIAEWLAQALPTECEPREIAAGTLIYAGTATIKKKRHDIFLCRRLDDSVSSNPILTEANAPIIITLRGSTGYRKHPVIVAESLIYFENGEPCIDHHYLSDTAGPKAKGKAGAKPQHDWPAYRKQFNELIKEYGLPGITEPELKNQAAIERRLTEWGEKNFNEAPAPSLLRSHIAEWLKDLRR